MSNTTFEHQQNLAEQIADQLARSGDPVGQAQVTALACGKIAARAELDAEQYRLFVKELCTAVAREANLSSESGYNDSKH